MRLVEPGTAGAIEVTVWDLGMDAAPVEAVGAPPPGVVVLEATTPAPELSEFFYRQVGGDWFWVDRLDWSADRWSAWVDDPGHRLLSCWLDGAPAGYVELRVAGDGPVEIAYFGLLRRAHGRGLGRWFLGRAIERAWVEPGTTSVWLHTCSLDGPAALPNYRARGFEVTGERSEWRLPTTS